MGYIVWCIFVVIQSAPLASTGLHFPWESLKWPLVQHRILKSLVVNCLHPEQCLQDLEGVDRSLHWGRFAGRGSQPGQGRKDTILFGHQFKMYMPFWHY